MGQLSPPHTGAWDSYYNADVDETEDQVTNGPAHLGGWSVGHTDAAEIYFHFYDALIADVTVGTTTPRITVVVGDNSTGASGGGASFSIPGGIFFETAIAIAATTTVGGSTGPTGAAVASVFHS